MASNNISKNTIFALENFSCELIFEIDHSTKNNQVNDIVENHLINETVIKRIKQRVTNESMSASVTKSSYASVLSLSLCYINKSYLSEMSEVTPMESRILIITGLSDIPAQYPHIINLAFASLNVSVPIDICALGQVTLSTLREASIITGGHFMRLALLDKTFYDFLEYICDNLFSVLILEAIAFKNINNFCFCHSKKIVSGFLCSICSTLTCKM